MLQTTDQVTLFAEVKRAEIQMIKKTEDKQEDHEENASQMAERIKGSARQIWLAGLGAYTKAEEDTGRFFDRLVREGEDIESKTRGAVERQVRAVEDRVGEVKSRATESWDRLESVFDQRVSRTLGRLGIPSRREIRELEARVAKLEAALARKTAAEKKSPARKSAAVEKTAPAVKQAEKKAPAARKK